MTVLWCILGALVLLMVIVLSLRVGITLTMHESLTVTARIGPKTLVVYPAPPKKTTRFAFANMSCKADNCSAFIISPSLSAAGPFPIRKLPSDLAGFRCSAASAFENRPGLSPGRFPTG
jgi:hypothetical protein